MFIWFYDYIRIIKPSAIRVIKNILFFIAFGCIIATAVVLASPASKNTDTITPVNSGGSCYDKKTQIEQAKKNCILRRFISYCDASTFRVR